MVKLFLFLYKAKQTKTIYQHNLSLMSFSMIFQNFSLHDFEWLRVVFNKEGIAD